MPEHDFRNAVFKITDTGSTLRTIAAIEEFVITPSAKLYDDTAPGSTGEQWFRGIEKGTITMRIKWKEGDAVDPDAIFSGLATHTAAVAVEYYPAGEATGDPKYTGNVWVTEDGWRITQRLNEMMKGEVQLVFDNGWTRGTA